MTYYPIQNPVLAGQLQVLVHFGSLERSFSAALDAFSATQAGLTIPAIAPQWRNIQQTPLSAASVPDFLNAAYRLNDDAQMLAGRFQDCQSRFSPDATARILVGQGDAAEARLLEQRERSLFAEMKGVLSPWAPGRAKTWFLSLPARLRSVRTDSQEAVFVNDDGRCIHLSQFHGDSVLLGYGLYASAMHYVEIGPKTPVGRSRALFIKEQDTRADATSMGLSLARSLSLFYGTQASTQREVFNGLIRVKGTDRSGKAPQESKAFAVTDAASLQAALQQLSPSHEITFETEELVAGRRGSSLTTINAIVPMGSIRFAPGKPYSTVLRAYYLSERSQFPGETVIPEELRRKLRFTRTP